MPVLRDLVAVLSVKYDVYVGITFRLPMRELSYPRSFKMMLVNELSIRQALSQTYN